MPKDKDLVPLFSPPLALMLARGEQVKGNPLTKTEVTRIRDKCICIMMERKDAEAMHASRGYRDVEPENAWADWHRLRVQMTGNGFLPKFVLCLVGDDRFPKQAKPILKAAPVEHEFRGPDPRMVEAFEASAYRIEPTLGPEELEAIGKHESVLYVLSKNFTAGEAAEMSRAMLRLGADLLKAGAIGMKCESAGIAHARDHWLTLAKRPKPWSAVVRAFVQMLIVSKKDLYTCGLHLLGMPDLIVAKSLKVDDVVQSFGMFALYVLEECAEGQFWSGHTFQRNAEAMRYRVNWEPCAGYDEDEFFFNPFGRWRFVACAD